MLQDALLLKRRHIYVDDKMKHFNLNMDLVSTNASLLSVLWCGGDTAGALFLFFGLCPSVC